MDHLRLIYPLYPISHLVAICAIQENLEFSRASVTETKQKMSNNEFLGETYPFEELYVRAEPKIDHNDPCPCGSGKKYKKCCLDKDEAVDSIFL